jgi:hypothetical protein
MACESSNLRKLLQDELNAITKQLKEHKKYSKSEDNDKTIKSVVNKYVLIKQSYKSYMEYCEVYELVQQSLIDKKGNCNDSREKGIINNQIMMNAIVLVQLYKYIDRGERYSPSDPNWGNSANIKEDNPHTLGYTGFGCDDFLSNEKRKSTLLNDLKDVLRLKSCVSLIVKHFMELDIIPMTSTDKLNDLKKYVDGLVFASDLTKVTLKLKASQSIEQGTAIMSPLVYLSDSGRSLPLDWSKDAWKCFGTHSTILRKVRLENIQDIRAKIDLHKGVIAETKLRSSIKEAMKSMIKVKSKEKESSVTSKSETMIGKRKLKKSIQSTKHEESDDDLFPNPLLDDGNQPNKEPTGGEVPVGDAMVGATEVKQLAQRAKKLMETVTKVPITNEEKKIVDDYMAVDMEKRMEENEKSLFLFEVIVSDTDGVKSDIVTRDSLRTLRPGV